MLVSIITPTYNRADTLSRAAKSVFQQNYDNLEYIIVDDGSTDETAAVVDQFDYSDLRYVTMEDNNGVSMARNKGVEEASGEAVLFLDADDELQESAIATLVEALQQAPESCVGVYGQQVRYKRSTIIDRSDYETGPVRYEDLSERNCMGPFGGKLLRRWIFDEIGMIDPSFPSSEDFDFFMRVVLAGYHFRALDSITYNKYLNDSQLSNNTAEMAKGMERVLEKYESDLSPHHQAERLWNSGHIHARKNRLAEARHRFGSCIRLYPFEFSYYASFFLATFHLYNAVYDWYSIYRGHKRPV